MYNHLIGDELVIAPSVLSDFRYSTKAFVFRAFGAENATNDDDGDGIRDLNGSGPVGEYEAVPDALLIPRFLGQASEGTPDSDLILIALSGGSRFTTVVDLLYFDDNEQAFSAQFTFQCWTKRRLVEINNGFLNTFLHPNGDPAEILGAPAQDAGWLKLDGSVAFSIGETIVDPAILAVLIERQGIESAADLPFGLGAQINGDLLSHHLLGDGPVPVSGDNQ